jgi:hypothetical protein
MHFALSATVVGALASLLLVACTGAQITSLRMQKAADETRVAGDQCFGGIASNTAYDPLRARMAPRPDDASLQMLTDQHKPTKREIALLYQLHGDIQQCRSVVLAKMANVHPLFVQIEVEAFAESDKIWAEFTRGNTTWGDFNQRRKALSAQRSGRFVAADAQIASNLENQHQNELAHRQRAAAAMQQWSYQQQQLANQRALIDAVNAPRSTTINCNYYGNSAQCRSQ